MKKLFLILLSVSSVVCAHAQSKSILVYGNFSVATDKQDYTGYSVQTSQWLINPGVGYQLNNMWTVGVQGSYGQSMMPYATNIDQTATNTDWTAGIFVRYTKQLGGIFSLYGQLDLSNAQGSYEISENGTNTSLIKASYVGFVGNLYPAISINIHKNFALNFNVGGISYSSFSWTNHPSTLTTENKLNIDFGHSLTIGISKNFACGKKMHGHHEPGEETRRMNTSDDDDDNAPKATKEKHHHKHHGKKDKKKEKKKSSDDDDE
jgi:hypothetical protein